MMQRARGTWFNRLASYLAVPVVAIASQTASADEWLDNLNKLAEPAPGEQDGTKILFDAIAGMDIVPDEILDMDISFEPAREIIPGMSGWDDLSSWAEAPAQQAVLEAVATITERKDRYILALPYTQENVPSDWSEKMLYVWLPEDGLLLKAGMTYQVGLDRTFALHWVEMVRLIESGDTKGAIDVMERTVRLSRILLERPTASEVAYATDKMIKSFEKILDTCRSFPNAFSPSDLADLNRRFEERRLLMDRQELPEGDKEIAGQLVARGIEERSPAEGARLARLMSGIAGNPNQRPLERFSRAAHWKTIAEQHADWFDVTDELDDLFGDWKARWALPDLKDPMLKRLTDYQKMDKRRFLILEESLRGFEQLFTQRMHLYTSVHGTRNAIAALGFFARNDRFPPELPAVQPQFIKKLDVDPYSIMPIHRGHDSNYRAFTRWEKHEMFEFFVPIRDQTFDRREEPTPYEVSITLPDNGGAKPSLDFPGEFDLDTPNLEQIRALDLDVLGKLLNEGEDWKTGDEIKADRLELIESLEFDQDDALSMQEDIQQMIDAGITPENYAEKMGIGDLAGDEMADTPFAQFFAIVSESMDQLVNQDHYTDFYNNVAEGNDLTAEDLKTYWIADTEAQYEPEYYSKQLEALTLVRGTELAQFLLHGRELIEQEMATQLNVALDDTNFILYSVGPDEADNDAKRCVTVDVEPKLDGTDILIYPPALSLRREQGAF